MRHLHVWREWDEFHIYSNVPTTRTNHKFKIVMKIYVYIVKAFDETSKQNTFWAYVDEMRFVITVSWVSIWEERLATKPIDSGHTLNCSKVRPTSASAAASLIKQADTIPFQLTSMSSLPDRILRCAPLQRAQRHRRQNKQTLFLVNVHRWVPCLTTIRWSSLWQERLASTPTKHEHRLINVLWSACSFSKHSGIARTELAALGAEAPVLRIALQYAIDEQMYTSSNSYCRLQALPRARDLWR